MFYKTGKQVFKSNIKETIITLKKDSNYYRFNEQKNAYQLNFYHEETLSIEKRADHFIT